jgi:hypothetical protein
MEGKAYLCPRPPKPGGGCVIHRIASLPFLLGRGRFRQKIRANFFMDDTDTSFLTLMKHTPKTLVEKPPCMKFHWLSVCPAKY